METRQTPDAKWQAIAAIDLGSIRQKLASKKSTWWHFWHSTARLEKEYRQFLFLIATNPGLTVVPWSQALDDFWHEHILDTAKYAADCNAVMGGFIHHNPHLPKGTMQHRDAFIATVKMYRAAFGEKAKLRGRSASDGAGCGAGMPVVFCGSQAGHSGGHHGGGGHHGCGGHGGGHGCGGHGCGGH